MPDPLPKPPKPGKDDKAKRGRPPLNLPRSVGQLPYLVPKKTTKEPPRINLSASKKKK